MNDWKTELRKKNPPKPREVWYVKDLEVRLEDEHRIDKRKRPVLVVSSEELTQPGAEMINIIPLTTSAKPDLLTFPINRSYERVENNFKIDNNSCAIIYLYQPIKIKYFAEKCGKIDETCYEAIQHLLCAKVIGYTKFDLDI